MICYDPNASLGDPNASLGHGFIGKQAQFFEVTRDKKVVWEFHDDAQFKTVNQVQLLDVPGDVTKGEVTR